MGHGSQYHRGVGSLGTLLPMHVLKGKKMPGHMGNETTTIQNLEVVSVDVENNIILVKGNVPGPKKSLVMIKTSVKKGEKVNETEELLSYVVVEEEPVVEAEETTEVTE
jgi:large subunit ribosomal protein L3